MTPKISIVPNPCTCERCGKESPVSVCEFNVSDWMASGAGPSFASMRWLCPGCAYVCYPGLILNASAGLLEAAYFQNRWLHSHHAAILENYRRDGIEAIKRQLSIRTPNVDPLLVVLAFVQGIATGITGELALRAIERLHDRADGRRT